MGLLDFFKKETPEEAVRRWQTELRKEMRAIDRQVAGAHKRGRTRQLRLMGHSRLPSRRMFMTICFVLFADIQREQKKTEKSIKDCLKRNDKASAKVRWLHTRD